MKRSSWIFGVVLAAGFGAGVLILPGRIIATYNQLRETKPELAEVYFWIAVGGSVLLAAGFVFILARLWLNTRRRERSENRDITKPAATSPVKRAAEVEDQLREAKDIAAHGPAGARAEIEKRVEDEITKMHAQQLEIAAFGTISSGKSALLNALAGREAFTSDPRGGTTVRRSEVSWPNDDKVTLIDTPGLAEVNGAAHEEIARATARSAELLLFVIDGALKSFEHDALRELSSLGKRVIVCVNKADWISDSNQVVLLEQLRGQVKGIVTPEDIVVVQSQRVTRLRTRVLPDGSDREETVEVEPNIDQLATRILAVVKKDGRDLLLGNLLLRAHALADDARERVRAHMDRRAAEVVDSNMWQAGAAAALVPVPVLDFAASSAVLVRMTLELARVYGQPMTLDAAGKLCRELGKNLVGVIGTAAIVPTVAATVASALKSVPGVGTLAGGALQGVVQALIARWVGVVMCEHFRSGMKPREGSIAELARAKWTEVTQPSALAAHLKASLTHLSTSKTPT